MKKPPVLKETPIENRVFKAGVVPGQDKRPVLQRKEFPDNFTFSFQYFNQIKFFEIGGVGNSWYISLIERLKELSKKNWQDFERSVIEKKSFRYHEIEWGSRNVPITRSDLNWIDDNYLNNSEDFPIIQFHVSKALGRVVGFWDAFHVFQIVLLDPKHNIQPSKYNDYKVDDTYFMSCEYSSLLVDLKKIQKKITEGCSCETCLAIKTIPTKLNTTNLLIAHLDDSYLEKLDKLSMTVEDIIELGLLAVNDRLN